LEPVRRKIIRLKKEKDKELFYDTF